MFNLTYCNPRRRNWAKPQMVRTLVQFYVSHVSKLQSSIFIFLIFVFALFSFNCTASRYQSGIREARDREVHTERSYKKSYTGLASYYHKKYDYRKTSTGEIYDPDSLTAAHPFLPFNTIALVTNTKNNKSVTVRINDRMPEHPGRVIDLSPAAAKKLGMMQDGIVEVILEIIRLGEQ